MEVDLFFLEDLLQREREKPLHDIRSYFQLLTKGSDFSFAQLPPNNKIATLLQGLKDEGFVSRDTTIEHFMVIFGIPLHKSNAPFEPIKWRKNKQLLRYFAFSIFHEEMLWGNGAFLPPFFADKHGEHIILPQSDKKRLKASADFDKLHSLLKNYNGCVFTFGRKQQKVSE
jgi:hypothetical protein|nr:MAG TPA: hypothetical protein [Caudoviricetes sp.]